jgi:CDP-diacylglycerol pyrophosphatase
VPTRRVKGIECPYIWSAGAPNYWSDAWHQAQPHEAGAVSYPGGIGLGINSATARQQDQLHIHLAGLLSGVREQLQHQSVTSRESEWARSVVSVTGLDKGMRDARYYRALHVDSLDRNLFALVRDNVPAARADMSAQMMLVTNAGSKASDGFYILNSDPQLAGPVVHEGGTGTCDYLLVYA